ncbi:hypothetical protein Tco_0175494 [Tanacetum coccineum]
MSMMTEMLMHVDTLNTKRTFLLLAMFVSADGITSSAGSSSSVLLGSCSSFPGTEIESADYVPMIWRGVQIWMRFTMGELGGVENTSALGVNGDASMGEDSFEDMSMTLVLAIFLRGFLVDDEALEVILEKIRGGFEADLLRFLGGLRMVIASFNL